MAESNDVQVLEKISTEVVESQIKIILSTQCIKAQTFLVEKLRKQSDRYKEVCSFISSANIKLVAEIKQTEQEINSLQIAQETIKLGNIQLKKELLLAKENKQDIIERVKYGKKKYEDMWLDAKNRFESLPYVQLLLENIEKSKRLESDLVLLENEAETLCTEIEKKRKYNIELDRKRIIELAEFIVNEMPNSIKIINEKSAAIGEIEREIDELIKEQVSNSTNMSFKTLAIDNELLPASEETKKPPIPDENEDLDDTLMMPKLQLDNIDLDDISVRLDQIKKDVNINNPANIFDSITYSDKSENNYDKEKSIDYIPSCFNSSNIFEENKTQNFSKRKLINILEDIKIDKNNAYNIVSKVNPEKLQTVTTISVDEINIQRPFKQCKTKINEPMESDEIEEIDLTCSHNILIPPTQFLDPSMDEAWSGSQQDGIVVQLTIEPEKNNQSPQEGAMKKKVSFDLPSSQSLKVVNETSNKLEENEANISITSQLDVSATSEESFVKIKDMIIKKHNLDLSPQFVYAKNNLIQMRKNDNEKIVLSKFFNQKDQIDSQIENMPEEKDVEPDNNVREVQPSVFQIEDKPNEENLVHMDITEMIESSPKIKIHEVHTIDKPVAGLLFTHGTQPIPESLNVSMSTTGYEDGDMDFPHCIDSSLLLSPKADIAMPMSSENPEILSQEVPNFLTGFRKTGLSFFGQMNSSVSKPDSSAQPSQGNSFNFNFGGGEDKKNRGGLFNMFN